MSVQDSSHDSAASATPAEPPAQPAATRYPLQFTGKAGEFFGIWIVNLALTVLTLGIYSAWAKVRTHRYFYGNARLAGSPFDYLADPITVLKGRLIAYAVVLTIGVSAKLQLFYILIPVYLALLLALPWIIYLSVRFRARYSAWRGLRFRFTGSVGDAYINFMLLPIVSVFTANLLSPWVHMQQQGYLVKHHRFGGKAFGFEGDVGKYYIPFLIVMGLGAVAFVIFFVAVIGTIGLGALAGKHGGDPQSSAAMLWVLIPAFVVFYAALFTLPIFLRVRYTNLMWQYARLGPHRFESTLRARNVLWLYFSNGVAILFTLGLAVPWAMVRMARYRAGHFALLAHGSLDDFVAEAGDTTGAAGSELVDALDLGLDLTL